MNKRSWRLLFVLATLAVAAGCANSYAWRPRVPVDRRTIAVPTFRNDSSVMELGAVATRQVLRELQREATFSIATGEEAALEVQGAVVSVTANALAHNRRTAQRYTACEMSMQAEVSVIDRRAGRVLVNNRPYQARTTFVSGSDISTAERDASGRLAEDLARQIVDDLLNLKW